ncbi:MAG TPA: 16S rRNA (guanine(527)-N(7))-methyltransferase RsmG [Micropruina sp.]|nr:16S rRNA (guanine(527)-N(7))-methyltransferase RsmG [Micropruina sp.]HMR21216.1 16S rRNA (guanine(527)-N(7))-methyltransferase RsmG [Micropruina sp.]
MEIARDVFGDSYPLAEQYVDILASRGVDWGLIGPREVDRLWSRHVLNSLAIAPLIGTGATVLDVGSGAGLPGLPLAIHRPDLSITLLEPLLRRANFLTQAVAELGLDERVSVVRGRAEEYRGRHRVVTARAVAALPKLLGWCLPLVAPGGEFLAIKGESAERELVEVRKVLRKRGLAGEVLTTSVHAGIEPTWVVRIR